MATTVSGGRVELRQSSSNALQLPIFAGVILLAIFVSEAARGPSTTVLVVCGAIAVADALLAVYLFRNSGATLVVTPDDITWNKTLGRKGAPPLVLHRTPDSRLTFRMAPNGIVGSQYTGYSLKLRDTSTGDEVFASSFGRRKVQQACESQGWTFE